MVNMPKKKKEKKKNESNFVIITGLSGSGMSSATNAFEDLGYFCVDNLPVTMLSPFSRLLLPDEEEKVAIQRAALVIDIRERHFLQDFETELSKLNKKGLEPIVLFFEASEEVLQRRFSETRRPHPADNGKGLIKAIQAEKKALNHVRENAHQIIDTSEHSVHTLRRFLVDSFGTAEKQRQFHIQLISFGHKYGVPQGLDLMFDVRHLPNPYFVPELKEFDGTNKKIVDFLEKQNEVCETRDRFLDLLVYLLPLYKREGKSYLTIGIGCTGGKHRSVYMTEFLSKTLADNSYEISTVHRDFQKSGKQIR
jgi:RNase adapter protein RapZ